MLTANWILIIIHSIENNSHVILKTHVIISCYITQDIDFDKIGKKVEKVELPCSVFVSHMSLSYNYDPKM